MPETSIPHDPPAPRFICDEMLKRVARWLRAAGYDTLVHDDRASDRAMVTRARREGRLVISRDRKLTELKDAAGTVLIIRANTLEGAIDELTAVLDLDWLHRPFVRCLVCNTLLVEADAEARDRLADGVHDLPGPVRLCPRCDKLFWAGGHVRRMRARLEAWAGRRPNRGRPQRGRRS